MSLERAGAAADPRDRAVLEELNRRYVGAVEASDVGWFDEHLASDFMNSNPDGTLVDRAGFLAQIARPSGVSRIEAHDVRIRLMADVAFVHARTTYIASDGRAGEGRYTDVWARQDGRWRCVCAQVTRVLRARARADRSREIDG